MDGLLVFKQITIRHIKHTTIRQELSEPISYKNSPNTSRKQAKNYVNIGQNRTTPPKLQISSSFSHDTRMASCYMYP